MEASARTAPLSRAARVALSPVWKAGKEVLLTPSGPVAVHVWEPTFSRWTEEPIPNPLRKPLINHRGECLCAELAIVRILQAAGWNAVFVNNYWGQLLEAMPGQADPIELPPRERLVYDRIQAEHRERAGAWDVFAWKDRSWFFVEAKRKSTREPATDAQARWLDAALRVGPRYASFAIARWDVD